jgi:hypothetical protein
MRPNTVYDCSPLSTEEFEEREKERAKQEELLNLCLPVLEFLKEKCTWDTSVVINERSGISFVKNTFTLTPQQARNLA